MILYNMLFINLKLFKIYITIARRVYNKINLKISKFVKKYKKIKRLRFSYLH